MRKDRTRCRARPRSAEGRRSDEERYPIAAGGLVGVAARFWSGVGGPVRREGTRRTRPSTQRSRGVAEAGHRRECVQRETDLREVRGGGRECPTTSLHATGRRVL